MTEENPMLALIKELAEHPERAAEFLPQLSALEEELLIASARDEGVDAVAHFGEYVFGVVPADHHRLWLEEEQSGDRVCIQAPPASAKTTWMIIRKTWEIGKEPLKTYGIGSAGEPAAAEMAEAVANTIEHNPRFRRVFPSIVPWSERGWSKDGYFVRDTSFTPEEWELKRAGDKNPTLASGGVGSKRFNGLRITGSLDLDDIHDRSSKTSDTICKEVVDFVKDTAEPRVEGGKLYIRQTRWNPKDVVNYCENLRDPDDDNKPVYKVFKHPAIIEPGTPQERSYWPEKRPLKSLRLTRVKVGEIDFDLVYQGNDTAALGQILKREAIHWFDAKNIVHSWTHYGGVDFAQKLQELTDKQAAVHSRFAHAMLAHSGSMLVLVDGFVDLIAMGEAENQFFAMCDQYRPAREGIEVNAQNRKYYNDLVRRKLEQGYAWLNLVPLTTSVNMGIRMSEMEPDFRLGVIQVSNAGHYFLDQFFEEWLGFGQKGKRNDTLSAVHLARQAAYFLLPVENPAGRHERESRKPASHPWRKIEEFYEVGR